MCGKMNSFKSIAVFHIDTTSLPKFDGNTTEIAELAILGCEIDHLRHSRELPRVLHKLTLLFKPRKRITEGATEISGLTNELLENVEPFTEESAKVLEYFIRRLPAPICIVAHYGEQFDFPILRRALKNVKKNLPDHVYCADSWKAFNELPLKPPEGTKGYRENLALKSIYKFLYKEKIEEKLEKDFGDPHRAEEFCEALLKCLIHCERFCEWMNEKAVPFNNICPLTPIDKNQM